MPDVSIIRAPISRSTLKAYVLDGQLVKAVVDCDKRVMAIGGELHADEEHVLLQDGSRQEDLWGINLYPNQPKENWIEFDSMINIRPRQGNRGRGIEDPVLREKICVVVSSLVQ